MEEGALWMPREAAVRARRQWWAEAVPLLNWGLEARRSSMEAAVGPSSGWIRRVERRRRDWPAGGAPQNPKEKGRAAEGGQRAKVWAAGEGRLHLESSWGPEGAQASKGAGEGGRLRWESRLVAELLPLWKGGAGGGLCSFEGSSGALPDRGEFCSRSLPSVYPRGLRKCLDLNRPGHSLEGNLLTFGELVVAQSHFISLL